MVAASMSRKRILAGVSLAVIGVVSSLVVWSPGCACTTPEMEFGWEAGMATPPDYLQPGQLSPAAIEVALARRYVGTRLQDLEPPVALRSSPCDRTGTSIQCWYWTATGPVRKQGFLVEFSADANGLIGTVAVRAARQWWGVNSIQD